jgi:hypothetical protein
VFSLDNAAFGALAYAGGQLYETNGLVLDALSGAALGRIQIDEDFQPISMVPHASRERGFFIVRDGLSSHLLLLSYDLQTFALTSIADLGYDSTSGAVRRQLVRWGTHGLAFANGTEVLVIDGELASAPPSLTQTSAPENRARRLEYFKTPVSEQYTTHAVVVQHSSSIYTWEGK